MRIHNMTAAMPGRRLLSSMVVLLLLLILVRGKTFAQENIQETAAPLSVEEKTMTRDTDFILIYGNKMKRTLHKKIDSLSMFARIDGKVQPIPFQVDEIDPDGEWVLPELPPDLKRKVKVDKDDDEGHFDENDELVFMISDSGGRIEEADYPEGAEAVDEIMLRDPVDEGKSWVYLCHFTTNPPLSDKDYVQYNCNTKRVLTQGFELGFSSIVPVSWDHLSFRDKPNMLDRMKIRLQVKVMGIDFHRDETDFKSTLSSYKDGQVRVIRRVRQAVKINKVLKSPSAASETIYFKNSVLMPYRVKVPVNLAMVRKFIGLQDIRVRGGADMQNLHGWRVRTDADPQWFTVDGTMDKIENSTMIEDARWFVLAGPPGAFLTRIILDRAPDGSPQKVPLETEFFYVDDDLTPDPPEFVPGQSPNMGFWIKNMEEMNKGLFYFYMIGYMIKDYQDGDEKDYLKIMDQPVLSYIN